MLARLSRLVFPIIFLVLVLGIYRLLGTAGAGTSLDFQRRQPRVIEPPLRPSNERTVTDEQLFLILDRLRPPAEWTNTNLLLHALRLWGPDAEFEELGVLSGETLRQFFLDDATFRKITGPETPPLFSIVPETGRVQVRDWTPDDSDRTSSSYHLNDILATLGETGTSLDTPLRTRNGDTNVEQLLASAMGQFHFHQHEFEWSAISYGRYVYPQSGWRNDYGERVTAREVVKELVHAPFAYGPCNGLHRLEAMVVLCGVDAGLDSAKSLGEQRARERLRAPMLKKLRHVVSLLREAQDASGLATSGSWTRLWHLGVESQNDTDVSLSDRILVTGHHLEWLALAPEELVVPHDMVEAASQWVVRAMLEVDDKTLREGYGPFSHAARALCLWRNQHPYEAWRNYQQQQGE
ncbi:MAG: hypothetical protein MK179_00890 [Pirellulaceae bacterium]|nr:hypothetical protein [Pirellulaceae bacterium]